MRNFNEEFILAHANDDVRQLALKAHGIKGIDLPFVLDQIAGRQTAKRKLPSWAAVSGVIYPPHLSMEQCSSERTAQYKAEIISLHTPYSLLLTDLTGGFGVDFSFMSRSFKHAVYVERQDKLCDIAKENFRLLGLDNAEVVCGDGEEYLRQMNKADVIYLDPARRDSNGAKTFAISDCTPDVVTLLPLLLQKATVVMVKLSPMLDWRKAIADIGEEYVREVHIVSVNNECKELLLLITSQQTTPPALFCVNFTGDKVSTLKSPLITPQCPRVANVSLSSSPLYLYEPNASIMKAACFDILLAKYENLEKIAPNSHLFTSDTLVPDFPGRTFSIKASTSLNKKELRRALSGITSANITTRNFPLSVADLRKRLKLKDGGDTYIFATTDSNDAHILYICAKLS